MSLPQKGDYIDIHVHGGRPSPGIFILETLMAHEGRLATKISGAAFTYGIHPWFLSGENYMQQIELVDREACNPAVIAIGEAGFDRLRGPGIDLQRKVFEAQVEIAERCRKPLIIHCVRSWDEILASHKKMKPTLPWMIHGFRGKLQLARQLVSKGFYLSFWFEYVLRPESADLLRNAPRERIFLETDGADVSIRDIYEKAAGDMQIAVEELKIIISENYRKFFNIE